uniref:Uncharacterized protein n=1 Tax=Oryza brachyantha TaxID=4533 RepID=J3N7R3_ORYBR
MHKLFLAAFFLAVLQDCFRPPILSGDRMVGITLTSNNARDVKERNKSNITLAIDKH